MHYFSDKGKILSREMEDIMQNVEQDACSPFGDHLWLSVPIDSSSESIEPHFPNDRIIAYSN